MAPRVNRWLKATIGAAIILTVIQIVIVINGSDPIYMPRVTTVLERLGEILTDREFLDQVIVTLVAWLEGLAIAALLGAVLGIILGLSHSMRIVLQGVIDFFRPIPSVALVPLGIVAIGIGDPLRLVLIVYAATWPIMFNVMAGVGELDPVQLETARVFGISRARRITNILYHNVLAYFSTGVRIAAPLALIIAISAEMLAGTFSGLGVWILQVSEGAGRNDLVLAGTVVAGLLGVVANGGIVYLQRRLLPWHPLYRDRG